MTRITCRLICHSAGTHIQQIYTGLSMLHRRGAIELKQELTAVPARRAGVPQHLRDASATHAKVELNGAIAVHFDMHDAQDIDLQDLDNSDFYFKRSFSRGYVGDLPRGGEKVLPYGLNYHVLPDFADFFAAHRASHLPIGIRARLTAMREALDGGNRFRFYSRVSELESPPDYALPPRVLFLVTAYDPHDHADRSAEKVEERMRNNEMRAECIRALRKELGARFLGGFNHNEYATRHYKDCLVSDAAITDKKTYIRTMKSHPICIATTGLHGSIGWKFAEYVACARAILSERLAYEVPGELAAGRNYLEFASPAECVEQALRLVADRELRNAMMAANSGYYRAHLRPDVLVLNSLMTALSGVSQ
jgi:hypothetical protein